MARLLAVQGKYPCIDFSENDSLMSAADGHADPEVPVAVLPLHVQREWEQLSSKEDQGWRATTEVENSGGGLDSILFCFIANLLLWLQDQVIYGNKLWGMNLKGFNTTDSRETSQFAGDGPTALETRAWSENGTDGKLTELHGHFHRLLQARL